MSNHSGGETFIKRTLEQLASSKEGKKLPLLLSSARLAQVALDRKDSDIGTMRTIFQPFKIACQSHQASLATTAVDCLGKLFTFNYWARFSGGLEATDEIVQAAIFSTPNQNQSNLAAPSRNDPRKSSTSNNSDNSTDPFDTDGIEDAFVTETSAISGVIVNAICDSFTPPAPGSADDEIDEKLQLQIVKALLCAVSSSPTATTFKGVVLMRAIKTTFNIFLLAHSQTTQMLAQTSLQQMVQALFGKFLPPEPVAAKIARNNSGVLLDSPQNSTALVSPLQTGTRNSVVQKYETESGVGSVKITQSQDGSSVIIENLTEIQEKKKKDPVVQGYRNLHLVFRTFCKLSMKPIPGTDMHGTDLRSPYMRSKLLTLHLLNMILTSHLAVLLVPTPLLFSSVTMKQFLCLALSRNTASIVPQVFDISIEIFGKCLIGLRSAMKKELSVIFTEIIIPIAEARATTSITFHQRKSLLKSLLRILTDPNANGGRVLVEIYLNYDCDLEATAQENIWERLITILSMSIQENNNAPANSVAGGVQTFTINSGLSYSNGPPSLTTHSLFTYTKDQIRELHATIGDHNEIKRRSLELLVQGILKPLVSWVFQKADADAKMTGESSTGGSEKDHSDSSLGLLKDSENLTSRNTDDPAQFQNLKHRKQVLIEGVKRFNVKPKKGMQYLLDSGCIPSRTQKDIALFLLHTEGLNKTMIGEFLGEGDEENIAIMHAFIDEMDFSHMPFVTALRTFLQSFRLPGESQKIDRFMLKFAGRYVQGNPTSFSSADTAYVLAYSVIMLNTDQHNAQVKKRMTKTEFLKNNRGIDEGKDISPEILETIFDEIQTNEIVMKEEHHIKIAAAAGTSSRDSSAALHSRKGTSEAMATKTEALFNNLNKTNKRTISASPLPDAPQEQGRQHQFIRASHFEHVKPMFSLIWMAILASISTPLQDSEDSGMIAIALEGFKYAAKIVCLFDLSVERKSFLSTLAKTTCVSSLYDLKSKHVESIACLLDIASASGNCIGENWTDVVSAICQLEKIQQLTAEVANQKNLDAKTRQNSLKKETRLLNEDAITSALCQSMTLKVDRVFGSSANLNGPAISEFVKAMCAASWEEITNSSVASEYPRMYCLQRLVEMSYYNMKRIRVEWSGLWVILGDHFNQVGCHSNSQVSFFALDKLRQLAMKFLELEELPNFKFQKDFLKPFDFILANNKDVKIKDMCLTCLQQMIQAKGAIMKSGWKAMLGAFMSAAKESHDQILTLSFDIVKSIFKNHFENIVANLAFPDFLACIVQFCKNKKNEKTGLQAIELLRQSISRIPEISKTAAGTKILQNTAAPTEKIIVEILSGSPVAMLILNGMEKTVTVSSQSNNTTPVASSQQDLSGSSIEEIYFKFWFPVFHSLYLVIMTCELEVRTRALNHLFDALKIHGATFSHDSWEIVANGVLFPIFDDLKSSKPESGGNTDNKFANRDELNVWVNTTMIQVLKQFIELFGQYLDDLLFCVDGIFDLLVVCMTQENETLARIGSTCLQQFIAANFQKIDNDLWEKFCSIFQHLFKVTTPEALFFDYRAEMPQEPLGVIAPPESDDAEAEFTNSQFDSPPVSNVYNSSNAVPDITGKPKPLKKDFPGIITNCILHLLIIQTLQEVLAAGANDAVYRSLSSKNLFSLIDCLERSYQFAKAFNEDMNLRMALYKMGFMKTLPNLLKQETSSVSTYIGILIKMYSDPSQERQGTRLEIEKRLIPLSYSILVDYNNLDPETKKRNVASWKPVVVTILNALIDFNETQFKTHIPAFYNEALNLLLHDVSADIRLVMHSLLVRTGLVFGITGMETEEKGTKDTCNSEKAEILPESMGKFEAKRVEQGDVLQESRVDLSF
ncbi:guanine nucleotide exchange protein for ADP-robosylation factor [Physocladia obscura]|uniref:Guanine nucleotide exchange protein for ADP-robosylation factor n=1 Tax=Physocladia obscura TaxID=109957 RepID=A0AAD5XHY2_9FUNG|nr:guanine nucleotide exchange protein for ADP-robosylation factor [Physocladia obscura]